MLFNWVDSNLVALSKGLSNAPETVKDLVTFCHSFLCLRLGKADWGGDGLVFDGEPLTPAQTLTMAGADGQAKAAPLYMLYLIYGFASDENARWLGERSPAMGQTIQQIIAQSTGEVSGKTSTGDSSESTQAIPDLPEKRLDAAPSTSSTRRSTTRKSAA